jgi:hypothetical protein
MLCTPTTRRSRRVRPDDHGIVTAEAAVVLPTLLVLLALAVTVLTTVGAKMKAVDASREAARIAARGDSNADAVRGGLRLAPKGAKVWLVDRSHWVEAEVRAEVRPFGMLPGFTIRASTLAEREGP